MNQIKIGRFIAERRRAVSLTQAQLAEKLGITDRAVSKWENGRSLPDSSIMLELCEILKINVNELLSGEVIAVDNYKEELEKQIITMIKEKEKGDKRLLSLEMLIGIFSIIIGCGGVFVASFFEIEAWIRILLIAVGMILAFIGICYAVKIEQVAGYYKCENCGHSYVPEYNSVFMARHIGRSRKMICPNCHKKTWHKKVISKD